MVKEKPDKNSADVMFALSPKWQLFSRLKIEKTYRSDDFLSKPSKNNKSKYKSVELYSEKIFTLLKIAKVLLELNNIYVSQQINCFLLSLSLASPCGNKRSAGFLGRICVCPLNTPTLRPPTTPAFHPVNHLLIDSNPMLRSLPHKLWF